MIAKRYAQALYELGKEQNALDMLHEEIKAVTEILKQEPDLQKVIYHPQISSEEKKELWSKIFGGKINELTLNFLYLVTDRKRETFLIEMTEELEEIMRAEKNITVAKVITAIELGEEQKAQLQAKLKKMTGKEKIELQTKVDSSIIGGIIVKIGNTLIDDSIAKHLASLKKRSKEIQLKGIGVNG